MKKLSIYQHGKTFLTGLVLALLQVSAIAQDSTKVTIDTGKVESWFSQNWMWVAIGAVVLIVLIAMMSGGTKRATVKKTTIVKEEDASGVVRTTTTEISE